MTHDFDSDGVDELPGPAGASLIKAKVVELYVDIQWEQTAG